MQASTVINAATETPALCERFQSKLYKEKRGKVGQ